jgi:hypothetical protein
MTNGSSAFLVDTNVLVYAYDPTDEDKRDRAIEVLEFLGTRQLGSLEDFNGGALLEGVRFLNPFTTAFDLNWLQPR